MKAYFISFYFVYKRANILSYAIITKSIYMCTARIVVLSKLSCVLHASQYYKSFWFLNQVHGGLRPAHAWFLKIDPVRIVSMRVYVCVSAPEAINN